MAGLRRRTRGSPIMAKRKAVPHGADAFDAYYSDLFGNRWQTLKQALLQDSKHNALFLSLNRPYYMDSASITAAAALPRLHKGNCLDMCAAPGGKTLVLCLHLGDAVQIQANDLSRSRHARLVKVLNEHLPAHTLRRIQTSNGNAALRAKSASEQYDRILLDAPCSSERHLLQNPKHLRDWSASRIKHLAQRQWSLLSAAFLLLKNHGFLLYATCALNPVENDRQIERLIKKYGTSVCIPSQSSPAFAEKTQYGCMFLPDTSCGSGPLYFSLIQKKNI